MAHKMPIPLKKPIKEFTGLHPFRKKKPNFKTKKH